MFAVDAWNFLELVMKRLSVVGWKRVLGRMRGIVLWRGQVAAKQKTVSERSKTNSSASNEFPRKECQILSASEQLKVGVRTAATSCHSSSRIKPASQEARLCHHSDCPLHCPFSRPLSILLCEKRSGPARCAQSASETLCCVSW